MRYFVTLEVQFDTCQQAAVLISAYQATPAAVHQVGGHICHWGLQCHFSSG